MSNSQVFGTAADSTTYAYLSGTAAKGSDKYIESNIWSVGANNELIPTWVNPNGDTVKMEIGYFPGGLTLATGSLTILRNHNGYDESSAPQIRLFVADQFTCGPF
ncbi:hypothetical protein M407DRAFT_27863 [Tulasnella calospora MUT 4182]|uniref:Uncharacterized protein n=1 Tax=Tulasnella calospora MUT 4182 TaxID=1051891 RepID=A0A0C3QD25_9AGAM|nr:hypothetical protein M407DRAFT_27863 [Tulasnella calospora MUT 4182]